MRVLVCGGRDFSDERLLKRVLDDYHWTWNFDFVIHGCARGADTLAGEWAVRAGVKVMPFPADWVTHGKGAGPVRNKLMLTQGRPHLVIAFPGGAGTADMVRQSKAWGVAVERVLPSGEIVNGW